jgi:hypothetical protein
MIFDEKLCNKKFAIKNFIYVVAKGHNMINSVMKLKIEDSRVKHSFPFPPFNDEDHDIEIKYVKHRG